MDIYDSQYFVINKKIQSYVGLWPYKNKKKKVLIRMSYATVTIAMLIPQVIGFHKHFGVDIDELLENLGTIFFIFGIFLKFLTSIYYEQKLKAMYDSIAKNWQSIKDKNERNILIKYSERGRMLTIGYITYMMAALIVYITMPMIPLALNIIKPLNESRPRMFILNGEFLVDKNEHYIRIFIFDCVCCSVTASVVMAVDTMYAAATEHCLGLFSIVKYRLLMPNKFSRIKNSYESKGDSSYDWMIEIIRLHSDVLQFANVLETTYSPVFLLIMGINTVYSSLLSVLVLISFDKLLNCVRYTMLLVGLLIHLFYLSWPGQKVIDHSGGLFKYAYASDWYKASVKSKTLLKFFTLRCLVPCTLTAGGLYIMNFENFLLIMKKSVSFITVFSSFR